MDRDRNMKKNLNAIHQKVFAEKESQTSFLLGGIGTGNISIGSRGNLKDIEIFNSPCFGIG